MCRWILLTRYNTGTGQCTCLTGYTGTLCNECLPGYGSNRCTACPACDNIGGTCSEGITAVSYTHLTLPTKA